MTIINHAGRAPSRQSSNSENKDKCESIYKLYLYFWKSTEIQEHTGFRNSMLWYNYKEVVILGQFKEFFPLCTVLMTVNCDPGMGNCVQD